MSKYAIVGAAFVAVGAGPAAALTAEEIWADWQAVYSGMGMTLSADSTTYEDGRFQIDGLTETGTAFGVESVTRYGSIALVEQADGSVTIDLPESLTMTSESELDGETSTSTVVFDTVGWSGVIRQDGDERIYDLAAESQTVRYSDDATDPPVSITVTLTGMSSEYVNTESDGGFNYDQTFSAGEIGIEAAAQAEPRFDFTWTMSDVSGTASGSLDLSDPGASPSLSEIGLLMEGSLNHSGSTSTIDGMSTGGPFQMTGSETSGRLSFEIGEDALSFETSTQDGQMAVQVAAFPVPINATLSEIAMSMTMPKGASDDEKPFGLSMALRDLAVDDQLWGMFDPTGQLPREPATIVIDLDGAAQMAVDIFGDPEAMTAMAGPPGEPRSLDLAELLVSIAGAELSGSGSVTFDNAGPVPQPVGSVVLDLTGGFALMDSLVALGFLPAEQAGMARGMVGMVAQPVGEDHLRSTIEFTEGGGITANGMPLR